MTLLFSLLLVSAFSGIRPPVPAVGTDLNDAQIAHIAVTANQLDVAAAREALDRSRNTEVRRFAETMIRDHEGVIAKAAALAKRLGVTPEDNPTSRELAANAAAKRESLASLDGPAFDQAYMENEVAYHDAVIGAVRDTLIPETRNGDLKSLLEAVLPALEAHRDHARRVLADLSSR